MIETFRAAIASGAYETDDKLNRMFKKSMYK
jgi:hypothetical protein